ncbi:MAG: septum formation initiator family protein [Rhodospirillales bacterium]
MGLIAEFRARARHVVGPAIGVCAVSYFAYHVIHGDRGLIAWRSLEQQVAAAESELARVQAEREVLEHRVHLLHPDGLDLDMLDEWSRRLLNYGDPDELVIFP